MEERPQSALPPPLTWPASEDVAPVPLAALPPPLPAPQARAVGFWRRWWALVIDSAILWFPLTTLQVSLGLPMIDTGFGREPDGRDSVMLLVSVLVSWLYTALLDASRAQGTLGKQVLGIRVERAEGGRLPFARASIRQLASYLSILLFGLGLLMCLWTRRRQTLHDKMAGAVLVRSEDGVPVRPPAHG